MMNDLRHPHFVARKVLCALSQTHISNPKIFPKIKSLFMDVPGVMTEVINTFDKDMILRVLRSGTYDLIVVAESFGLSFQEVLLARDKTRVPVLYIAEENSSFCSENGVVVVGSYQESELQAAIRDSVQNALVWSLSSQVAYEKLLSKILSSFINLDACDVKTEVMKALEEIGMFFRVDKVHIWTFAKDGELMEKSFNWTAPGIDYHFEVGRQIPVSMYSWIVKQLKKSGTVSIASAAELPLFAVEDRDLFRTVNTKSFLAVPMISAHEVQGFIGFSSVLNQREWGDKTIALLKIVSRVFVTLFEKQRVSKALTTSQEQFGNVVEHLNDGLLIADSSSSIVYANSRFLEICSMPISEVIDSSFESIFGLKISEILSLNPSSMSEKVLPTRFEYLRKDGRNMYLELRASHVAMGAAESQLILTVSDVTSQRALEQELQHSQKMEAIGLLAGGIAHDFNNLLTAILGYSGLLLNRLPETSPYQNELSQIKKASEQAADLVGQLLTFSRKQVLVPKVLNVNTIVKETAKMLRRTIGENISVELSLDDSLANVCVDRTHLQQILLNLVINARDAMPEGGELKITSNMLCLTESIDELNVGTYVQFSVQDNGCGMEPKVVEQIFDPFFTTKSHSKGTGLGLSTVYGAVKQNGGHVFVESKPSEGSVFRILLPAVEEQVVDNRSSLQPEKIIGGKETVLLVEDERGLRSLLRQILEEKGYRVIEAINGRDAVSKSEYFNSEIDLMVSDILMPEMSGDESAEIICAKRPKMKVLFISGYQRNKASRFSKESNFMQKPFTPDLFARRVREVLDSADCGPACSSQMSIPEGKTARTYQD